VTGSIEIKRTPYGLISVTYKDRNRDLAADIANDIVSELDFLNKKFIITAFKQKLGISDSVVKDIAKENVMASSHFDSLLTKFTAKISSIGKIAGENSEALQMQRSLMQLTIDLKSSTDDLKRQRKMYRWSVEALESKNLPSVTPIQKALPDTTNIVRTALFFATMASICAFFVSILAVYFLERYASYIKVLFSRK
jgi:hypothetical protein